MILENILFSLALATQSPQEPMSFPAHKEYALKPEYPRLASEPLVVDLRKDPRPKGKYFGMPKHLSKDYSKSPKYWKYFVM